MPSEELDLVQEEWDRRREAVHGYVEDAILSSQK